MTLANALLLQLHADTGTVAGPETNTSMSMSHRQQGEAVVTWMQSQQATRGSSSWRHPTEHALTMARDGDPHRAISMLHVQAEASISGLFGSGTSSKEAFACIVDMLMAVAPEILL